MSDPGARIRWNLDREPVSGLIREAIGHLAHNDPDDGEPDEAMAEAFEQAAVHVAVYWLPGVDRMEIAVRVRRRIMRGVAASRGGGQAVTVDTCACSACDATRVIERQAVVAE